MLRALERGAGLLRAVRPDCLLSQWRCAAASLSVVGSHPACCLLARPASASAHPAAAAHSRPTAPPLPNLSKQRSRRRLPKLQSCWPKCVRIWMQMRPLLLVPRRHRRQQRQRRQGSQAPQPQLPLAASSGRGSRVQAAGQGRRCWLECWMWRRQWGAARLRSGHGRQLRSGRRPSLKG